MALGLHVQPDEVTTKRTSIPACPVPLEQQPLNEYRELSESDFFGWGTMALPQYIQKVLWVWAWGWVVAGPVAAGSFAVTKYPIKFALFASAGASIFVMLMLVRLYFGWAHVRSRLASPAIFYEESGWYDGQVWEKPPEVLVQDRLIVSYEVQPIFKRLHWSFTVLVASWLVGVVIWMSL
jgi:hypothetical protein